MDRKLWRNYLPRMKYYNPNLEVDVKRREGVDKTGPSTVTVHFSMFSPYPLCLGIQPSSHEKLGYSRTRANPLPPLSSPLADQPSATIDGKRRLGSELCKQILEMTKAEPLPHNPNDALTAAKYTELVHFWEASARAREARMVAKREQKEKERLGGVTS